MNFEITEAAGAQVFSDIGVLKEYHQIYRETPAQKSLKKNDNFSQHFFLQNTSGDLPLNSTYHSFYLESNWKDLHTKTLANIKITAVFREQLKLELNNLKK